LAQVINSPKANNLNPPSTIGIISILDLESGNARRPSASAGVGSCKRRQLGACFTKSRAKRASNALSERVGASLVGRNTVGQWGAVARDRKFDNTSFLVRSHEQAAQGDTAGNCFDFFTQHAHHASMTMLAPMSPLSFGELCAT
jgi:hypothetical protein